jgi:predicted AAA+ superfamily ATPase
VVGGMPAAVQRYIDTKDIRQVLSEQQAILVEYRKDISQYDEDNSLRIRMVFDRLAPELSKKNKRFYADSLPECGRFERLEDEFVWLTEAGVAIPAFNVSEPKLPLRLAEKPNFFKLFMNDVGLLAAMYMNGIQVRILNGEAEMNFGAVYENVIAQELTAHGFRPTYYTSRIHGEIDFVVEYNGRVLPIEVKCGKDYARHRALSRIMGIVDYGIREAIVFDRDALRVVNNIFYAPIYMMMFLKSDNLPDQMIYEV